MGRKRIWANEAERQRARRQRQAEGGTRDVRIRLSAEASAILDQIMQRQRLTARAPVEVLLLATASQRGTQKPKKRRPKHPARYR